jgi:hypothetical protein
MLSRIWDIPWSSQPVEGLWMQADVREHLRVEINRYDWNNSPQQEGFGVLRFEE